MRRRLNVEEELFTIGSSDESTFAAITSTMLNIQNMTYAYM